MHGELWAWVGLCYVWDEDIGLWVRCGLTCMRRMRRAVKIDEDTDSPTPEPPPEGQAERVVAAMKFSAHQRREVWPAHQRVFFVLSLPVPAGTL